MKNALMSILFAATIACIVLAAVSCSKPTEPAPQLEKTQYTGKLEASRYNTANKCYEITRKEIELWSSDIVTCQIKKQGLYMWQEPEYWYWDINAIAVRIYDANQDYDGFQYKVVVLSDQ